MPEDGLPRHGFWVQASGEPPPRVGLMSAAAPVAAVGAFKGPFRVKREALLGIAAVALLGFLCWAFRCCCGRQAPANAPGRPPRGRNTEVAGMELQARSDGSAARSDGPAPGKSVPRSAMKPRPAAPSSWGSGPPAAPSGRTQNPQAEHERRERTAKRHVTIRDSASVSEFEVVSETRSVGSVFRMVASFMSLGRPSHEPGVAAGGSASMAPITEAAGDSRQ
mmetsp:Transcript_113056/g.241320  ORF Transcript_113056/g.241320 Transcript_113056/m.241320 type:complete len:222 (+) Transcript_113056:53-718(+)